MWPPSFRAGSETGRGTWPLDVTKASPARQACPPAGRSGQRVRGEPPDADHAAALRFHVDRKRCLIRFSKADALVGGLKVYRGREADFCCGLDERQQCAGSGLRKVRTASRKPTLKLCAAKGRREQRHDYFLAGKRLIADQLYVSLFSIEAMEFSLSGQLEKS